MHAIIVGTKLSKASCIKEMAKKEKPAKGEAKVDCDIGSDGSVYSVRPVDLSTVEGGEKGDLTKGRTSKDATAAAGDSGWPDDTADEFFGHDRSIRSTVLCFGLSTNTLLYCYILGFNKSNT